MFSLLFIIFIVVVMTIISLPLRVTPVFFDTQMRPSLHHPFRVVSGPLLQDAQPSRVDIVILLL